MLCKEKEKAWVEKYRPLTIEDCILPAHMKKIFLEIIKDGYIPNMLFHGSQGTGKTTVARALCEELGVDYIIINASDERGLDMLRTKVTDFASTVSLSGNGKCIVLDECLSEDEYVLVGSTDNYVATQLKNLEYGVEYPIVSFNMDTSKFENDTGKLISDKEDTLYEVELEDGRTIVLNSKHPFIVNNNGHIQEKSIDSGLSIGDTIVCYCNELQNVKSIKKLGIGRVRNLTVDKNHTFVNGNGIVTHNCDHLLPATQAAFRNSLEALSANCSFIWTANYPSRIIPALHSRLANVDFKINEDELEQLQAKFFMRVCDILNNEHITYDETVLYHVIVRFFPDNRKIIQELQQYSKSGVIDEGILMAIKEIQLQDLIVSIKNRKFKEIRQWAADNSGNDLSTMYEKLYNELVPSITPDTIGFAIRVLDDYQRWDATVPSKELHVAALCVDLMLGVEFK